MCATCGQSPQSKGGSGDLRDLASTLPALFWAFLLLHFHATASFVEAALRLINSQTICQTLSTVSGCVPPSNEAFSSGAQKNGDTGFVHFN